MNCFPVHTVTFRFIKGEVSVRAGMNNVENGIRRTCVEYELHKLTQS